MLKNAKTCEIECILEIIQNTKKLSPRYLQKCKKSLQILLTQQCNQIKINKRILCLHVPALRILIAAALLYAMEIDLNFIFGGFADLHGFEINEFQHWNRIELKQ